MAHNKKNALSPDLPPLDPDYGSGKRDSLQRLYKEMDTASITVLTVNHDEELESLSKSLPVEYTPDKPQ